MKKKFIFLKVSTLLLTNIFNCDNRGFVVCCRRGVWYSLAVDPPSVGRELGSGGRRSRHGPLRRSHNCLERRVPIVLVTLKERIAEVSAKEKRMPYILANHVQYPPRGFVSKSIPKV